MKLHIKGIVIENYHSEKSGSDFITISDDDGGQLVLNLGTIDGSKLKRNVPVEIEASAVGTNYNGKRGIKVNQISVKNHKAEGGDTP